MIDKITPTEFYIDVKFLDYFSDKRFYNHDINGTARFLYNISDKIFFKVKENELSCYNCIGSITPTFVINRRIEEGKLIKINKFYLIHTPNSLYVLDKNEYSIRYITMLHDESSEVLKNPDKFIDLFVYDEHNKNIAAFGTNKSNILNFANIIKCKNQEYFNNIVINKIEEIKEESVDHLKERLKTFIINGSKEEDEMKTISLKLFKLIGEEKTREFIASCYNF